MAISPLSALAPEGRANARLIASAPDLLAIAKELLELEENWPGIAYTQDLSARARAAISKAEVGQP